jgi:hypothetical protein
MWNKILWALSDADFSFCWLANGGLRDAKLVGCPRALLFN